jgi:ribosomal protein S11
MKKKIFKKPAIFIFVNRTNNNVFLSLTHRNGKSFYHSSAGILGLSGSRRDSPTSCELAGKAIAREVQKLGYRRVYLKIGGLFDPSIRGVIRGLRSSSLILSKFHYVQPTTHNGIRLRKPRRM